MRSAGLRNSLYPFIVFVSIFFLAITYSFGQTKQSYRNHEEIEVGGGMKVEILRCTGEGPTEVCDCIYFTDKRQNGTRIKQNANRIKEEERAALLAKGISMPPTKKSNSSIAGSGDNRADKTIPSSLTEKPSKPVTAGRTLEEAAKKADSVAKASSQKMRESLAKVAPEGDSTEMDQVFIPRVTETGGTRLESSVPTVAGESIKSNPVTTITETTKDTIPATTQNNVSASLIKDTTAKPPEKTTNATVAKNLPESTSQASSETNAKPIITNKNAAEPVVSTPVKTNISDTISKMAIKDTAVSSSSQNNISAAAEDNGENNYVKQYKGLTASSDNVADTQSKKSTAEIKTVDSAAGSSKADLITTLKTELAEKSAQDKKSVPSVVTEDQNPQANNVKDVVSALPVTNSPPISSAKAPEKEPVIAKADEAKNAIKDTTSAPATTPSSQSVLTHNDPVVSIENANNKISPISRETNTAIKNTSTTIDRNVIGKGAEVKTKGEWEKATIIDKETEFLYKVHYRGRSADYDEWVSVTQIRNIDNSAGPASKSANKPTSEKPTRGPKVNLNCSFEPPAPPVSGSEKFSERLAKRKIYEQYVNSKNKVKTGITFLSMEAENPIVNTVSISSANVLEIKFAFAPAGAMIYPVRTEYKVCEQVLGKTSSKTINASFACFRNKEGAWTCADLE